ncbi:hypothetical protein DFA_03834 [Cavenderia fasciculata]|uniref:SH2 domain-containing protein n=1 Tax=Cavenderia fasciculata TaxID=261658 RepID=F4Q0I9_CACFS|nr:uncharacterized protein DFA_03834 [Cavenderia fasciculata]EGG18340.1 hypothetical protein DFA_03834 [Cavenderia fasciculata]|eukprot:XP_004366244.1 hypothetical protein DFA_03834 [Cavenderia fasciculata]
MYSNKEIERELKKWTIELDEIELMEEISSSPWSKIHRALVRGLEAAVKIIDLEDLEQSIVDNMLREVMILLQLRNPNIILLMGVCKTPSKLYIVTEYLQGSVYHLIKQQQQLQLNDISLLMDTKRALMVAKDVSLAMNWMHRQSPPMVHLNLKPSNILYGTNFQIKISDFSLCKVKQGSKLTGQAGSTAYMAPEILQNREYNERSDVYSFGISLWAMLTQRDPYEGMFKSYPEMVGAIEEGVRPPIDQKWSNRLKDFLYMCWHKNPVQRPSFQEIIDNRMIEGAIIHELLQEDMDSLCFWKSVAKERTEMGWEEFYHGFVEHLGLDSSVVPLYSKEIKCLKQMLEVGEPDSNRGTVQLEHFARFTQYFGPITRHGGMHPLDRMWDVCTMPGFRGAMSTNEVHSALAGQKKGAYLVRFSFSEKSCYTISYVASSRSSDIGNIKVLYDGNRASYLYKGGKTVYPSFQQLITRHQPKNEPFREPMHGGPFLALQLKLPLSTGAETVYLAVPPSLFKHI